MKEREKIFLKGPGERERRDGEKGSLPASAGEQGEGQKGYPAPELFIYRLLKFADDMAAYSAYFQVERDKLIFSCKSKKQADFSRPYGDACDIEERDLNFKMEKFIESISLDQDFGEGEYESKIVYKFKTGSCGILNCISDKVANLQYPNLFLNSIRKIFYDNGKQKGLYDKRIEYSEIEGDISVDLVKMRKSAPADPENMIDERLWLFGRSLEDGEKYSVGFFIGEDEKLIATSLPAFSTFPTEERTGLKFIINAPFRSGQNREGLKRGDVADDKLLHCLARLGADSLECLKELGIKSDMRLMDDILDIIPCNPSPVVAEDAGERQLCLPFYTAFLDKFKSSALIPCTEGFTDLAHAYWSPDTELMDLFSRDALRALVRDANADWAFPLTHRQKIGEDQALEEFINKIIRSSLDEDKILKGFFYKDGETLAYLNSRFIESRSPEWLNKFYGWILKKKDRIAAVKNASIFLDRQNKAFSIQSYKGIKSEICPELLQFDNCRKLIKCLSEL